MTTIAYKDGVMAGDTRAVIDEVIEPGHYRKVFKLKDGSLIGFAGNVPDIQAMIREMKKDPNKTMPGKSDLYAIKVTQSGKVMERDAGGWSESEDAKYYAIGSGRVPALVAMHCGKSAKQAIEIAMKFDRNTGGKVQTVRLK